MSRYVDVQFMSSVTPIQEYEIELKIDAWKKRHSNAHVTEIKIKKRKTEYYNYAITLVIIYQANSKVVAGVVTKEYEKHLHNFPGNFNNTQTNNRDGSKGLGYVARENGKFGSYPAHDDYSGES